MITDMETLKERYIFLVKKKKEEMSKCICEECAKEFEATRYSLKTHIVENRKKVLCRACRIKDSKSKVSPQEQAEINKKREQTCLKKFGVKTALETKQAREGLKKVDQKEKTAKAQNTKSTRTYIHRGGLERKEVREQARETLIKNHGVSSYFHIINKEKREKRYDMIVEAIGKYSRVAESKEHYSSNSTEGKRIPLICLKCGEFYENTLTDDIKRCPLCYPIDWKVAKSSKGERLIESFLKKKKIDFIPQKSFDGLLGDFKYPLRFDFYLPKYNLCIEYQGEQHYHPTDSSEREAGALTQRKKYDQRKRNFCEKENIGLLEIKYSDDLWLKLKEIF